MDVQKIPVPQSAGLSYKNQNQNYERAYPMSDQKQKRSIAQSAMDYLGERLTDLNSEKQMSHPIEKEENDSHFEEFLVNRVEKKTYLNMKQAE